MRFSAIICVALLVVGSIATSTEDQEIFAKLRQMDATEFGKTMLDTIQLQLASGDPMDDLIELLRETYNFVYGEQNDDDAYIKNIRGGCDTDIGRLRTEITAANDRASELQAELDEKIPLRAEKTDLLHQKEELLAETGDRIVELDEDKAEHDADWAAEQQEHDRATYVIERAKEVIQNGFSGSFLQKNFKPAAMVQVSEHFKNNAKSFKRTSWNKIFKMLASITAAAPIQADSGAIGRILELIDNLLEKIAESRDKEENTKPGLKNTPPPEKPKSPSTEKLNLKLKTYKTKSPPLPRESITPPPKETNKEKDPDKRESN